MHTPAGYEAQVRGVVEVGAPDAQHFVHLLQGFLHVQLVQVHLIEAHTRRIRSRQRRICSRKAGFTRRMCSLAGGTLMALGSLAIVSGSGSSRAFTLPLRDGAVAMLLGSHTGVHVL